MFFTDGKIVFHMSILSIVHLGNVFASDRLSYSFKNRIPRDVP